jgi:uracil-DNA glycosylase
MPIRLVDALSEMLDGWVDDLNPSWRDVFVDVDLGFDDIDPGLELLAHEPIFPGRRKSGHLGAPEGAHVFHAFDDIDPQDVRCIMLGQDPYPCMAFSTGRAFDIGSYASWRELEGMFTHSMRSLTQCVCAERSGQPELASGTADWQQTIAAIESSQFSLEAPPRLAQTWVDQGVLLMNASLTISRFRVSGDPHQTYGHTPLWRPFMIRLLCHLLQDRENPPVVILFGDAAKATLSAASTSTRNSDNVVATEHPAAGDGFLANGNPLSQCNAILVARGEKPIKW